MNFQVLFGATALTVHEAYEKLMNFTYPISVQSYCMMIPRPKELSRLYLFVAPFTLDVSSMQFSVCYKENTDQWWPNSIFITKHISSQRIRWSAFSQQKLSTFSFDIFKEFGFSLIILLCFYFHFYSVHADMALFIGHNCRYRSIILWNTFFESISWTPSNYAERWLI